MDEKERRTASFGRKSLLARRLIDSGVRFVQGYDMRDKDGWDAHGELVKNQGTPYGRGWKCEGDPGVLA